MPHLIGRVGKSFKSIDVGRDTFKAFCKLAVRHRNHTANFSDFTDDVFREIASRNLPFDENTIKSQISNL